MSSSATWIAPMMADEIELVAKREIVAERRTLREADFPREAQKR